MKYVLVLLFVLGLIGGINLFNTEKPIHKTRPKIEQKIDNTRAAEFTSGTSVRDENAETCDPAAKAKWLICNACVPNIKDE